MIVRAFTAALLGAILAANAPAQTAPTDREIVVNGKRQSYQRDRDDVRAVTAQHDGQIARFQNPVCPLVTGLPRDYAAVVEGRIRALAAQAKLATASAGCAPNLAVLFASDGVRTVAALRKQRPRLFASLTLAELDTLDRSTGPAWSWTTIEPKRRDGGPVEHISEIAVSGPPEPAPKGAYILSNADLSLLHQPMRLDVTLSFVVIDLAAVDGLSLAQVGDAAAMLGLGAIRPDRIAGLDRSSILHALDRHGAGDTVPDGATPFDIAYLRGLYSGDPSESFDQRSNHIAHALHR